jgi:hypothetical protein
VQNSGTRRSLCRLRLRLFHVMLDVFLIVCLVVVTAQKNPLFRFVCSFSFVRHLDVMHRHTSFTLHVFVKSKII